MARPNADVAPALVDAVNRGDIDALLPHVHHDAEIGTLRSVLEGGYRGHDGLRAFLADNVESFAFYEARPTEVRDLGDGRVLMLGSIRVRGKGSGAETEVPMAALMTFRDGLVVAHHDFGDHAAALAAAGLDPSATG